MVAVVQLVRISVCGTEGRGFEPHRPPKKPRVGVRARAIAPTLFFYIIPTLTPDSYRVTLKVISAPSQNKRYNHLVNYFFVFISIIFTVVLFFKHFPIKNCY